MEEEYKKKGREKKERDGARKEAKAKAKAKAATQAALLALGDAMLLRVPLGGEGGR